jgi:hypothetical protein
LQVDDGVGVGCLSKSDLLVASVQDTVESFKGKHAKDEVKSWLAIILYNQIDPIGITTKFNVKVLRQDLSVRSECEGNLVKKKKGD